jgi:hypothetical protein
MKLHRALTTVQRITEQYVSEARFASVIRLIGGPLGGGPR